MKKSKGHWILGNPDSTVRVKILRWIARIWSLLALIFALVMAFNPDPYAVNLIKALELFMLSLWLIAILGLVLGWRFERLGALITLIIMPVREMLYVLFYREWTVNFLLIWALVIPPAVMYLLAWSWDRKKQIRSMIPSHTIEGFLKFSKPDLREIVLELRNIVARVAPGAAEDIRHGGIVYYFEELGGPVSAGI